MAKIIYKKGCEGRNRLECIEGIEIDMLTGQKCIVFPKYEEHKLLNDDVRLNKWKAPKLSVIEALKVTNTTEQTDVLLSLESPAAKFVRDCGNYNLPSLMTAMEICGQSKEIDALAKQIEGAELLCDYYLELWSSCRYNAFNV